MNSKTLLAALLFVSFLLLSIPMLASADYYVSPTGNNSWLGNSEESPWETIQYAVDNIPPDNIIMVMDGTYTENVEINKQVILRSVDWEDNAENDSAIVVAGETTDHVISVFASNVIIEGFTVYGATGAGGINIGGETNCTIANNIVGLSSGESNDYGINLYASTRNNISNNTCNYNRVTGIIVSDSSHSTILSNTCNNNGLDGITIKNSSADNIISENTCSNNGDSGISIDNNVESNTFLYNTCSSNSVAAVEIGSNSTNNRLYLNNFSGSSLVSSESGCTNFWSSETDLKYLYNGKWRNGYVGNYYSSHTLTDSNGDGITDSAYDLPNNEPDDAYPIVTTPGNFTYLERGLVAYYPFNGNADDESEFYSNDGTVTGADLAADRFNKANSAYLFGGSAESDKIDCGNNSSLDISKAISISVWIKPSTLTGRIIKKRGFGGYEFDISNPNIRVSFNGNQGAFTSISGMENQWIFVTTTWDGASNKMFVNGSHQGYTSPFTGAILTHRDNFLIGIHSTYGQFDGIIDEVRVYNRALSQEEITKLYNEGKTKINAGLLMLLLN